MNKFRIHGTGKPRLAVVYNTIFMLETASHTVKDQGELKYNFKCSSSCFRVKCIKR